MTNCLRSLSWFVCVFVVFAVVPVYADRVFVIDGAGRTRSGKITAVTRDGVTIESVPAGASRSETVAANQILYTTFDDDPPRLLNVRASVAAGRFGEARDELGKIAFPETAAAWTRQDHRFLAFKVTARHAIASVAAAGDATRDILTQAAEQGIAFITDFPQSYHYYEVCRTICDVLGALDDTEPLTQILEFLAAAPWASERLYAVVALGELAISRGDVDSARRYFSNVVGSEDSAPTLVAFHHRASVGLARCFAKEQKWAEAEAALDELITSVGKKSPNDAQTLALFFNALGDTLRDKGSPGEAVIAYLHTELLYPAARREWLYALRQLEDLWRRLDKPDRANAAATKIKNALAETKR